MPLPKLVYTNINKLGSLINWLSSEVVSVLNYVVSDMMYLGWIFSNQYQVVYKTIADTRCRCTQNFNLQLRFCGLPQWLRYS